MKENIQLFYILEKNEYIKTYYSGSTELLFVNEIKYDKKNVAIEIRYFDNIGYYYELYNNKNKIKLCEVCQKPFIVSGKNAKYCKEHRGYQKIKSIKFKKISCVICGKEFEVDIRNSNKIRCDKCQKERNILLNRISSKERMKKHRENTEK